MNTVVKYTELFKKFDYITCSSLPWIVAGRELLKIKYNIDINNDPQEPGMNYSPASSSK